MHIYSTQSRSIRSNSNFIRRKNRKTNSLGNSKNGSPVSHFTQIVWKHTKKVGCAVSVGRWKIFSQSYYICCYYYPGGNLSGKYIENVGRP